MIAFVLLNFRRCCVLRLEGRSQVGIIPISDICVSSEGRMMPCYTFFHDCLRRLCCLAGMHPMYLVGSLL
jgi:hypothetical protein